MNDNPLQIDVRMVRQCTDLSGEYWNEFIAVVEKWNLWSARYAYNFDQDCYDAYNPYGADKIQTLSFSDNLLVENSEALNLVLSLLGVALFSSFLIL